MPPRQSVNKKRRGRERRGREKKRRTGIGENKEEEDKVRCLLVIVVKNKK